MLVDPIKIGLAAEFLVCYEFAKRGFLVSHMPFEQHSYDLLVDTGAGAFLRVQSKGTLGPSCGDARKRYRFTINRTDKARAGMVDIFALVALDRETVHFVPRTEIIGRSTTIWVPRHKFGEEGNTLECVLNHEHIAPLLLDTTLSIGHQKAKDSLKPCKMVGHVGVEPTTNGLRVRSPEELRAQ